MPDSFVVLGQTRRPRQQKAMILDVVSHPTRSSPLPYVYKIADAYDTATLWNAITPKTSFSRPSRVFSSSELHQHFVRDHVISHSCQRINVGKLKATAFKWTEGTPHTFLGRTRHRVHLETKDIDVPFSRESLLGDITSSFITSSAKGTPAPRNTMFGRNLNVNVEWVGKLPIHGTRVRVYAPLDGNPVRLPQVVDTPNTLAGHVTVSPPVDLISNLLQTLFAGDEQWESILVHGTCDKVWECLGWTTWSTLWAFHNEVDGAVEVL